MNYSENAECFDSRKEERGKRKEETHYSKYFSFSPNAPLKFYTLQAYRSVFPSSETYEQMLL